MSPLPLRSTVCGLVLLLVLSLAGCRDVRVLLVPSGIAEDDVMLEVADLGRPAQDLLERRARAGDIDGARLLDDAACDGPCRALLVTLFITNRGSEPAAPPVVRLSAPPGKPERPPIALTAKEISEGRAGRIRFLLSLWPGEDVVEVRPSGSVFIEVQGAAAAAHTDAPASGTVHDATRNE